MSDNKDSKEVINLAKIIILAILKESCKDGFQISDLGAFLNSEKFLAAVQPAIENIQDVPKEFNNLDFIGGLDLGRYTYSAVMEIIEELKSCKLD